MTTEISPSMQRQLESLFRGVRHTLLNRGLYRPRKDGGVQEVAFKRAILFDRLGVVAFEVDVQRLPVKIEQLLNPEIAHQMQASLGGRRVRVTNSRGLLFGVRLEPDEPQPRVRLPRRVPLDLETRPGRDNPSGRPYLIPVGQGASGPLWRSLLDTGHVLVGGETGSGKSTWLNAVLATLLAAHTPQELQIAIVDPKMVEFQVYRGLPHLFDDVATEVDQAASLLARILAEMDRRQVLFARAGVKSLAAYNRHLRAQHAASLPLLLLIVDEVTDIALQAGLKSAFYKDLIRLVSKGRAFGLVVVLATQNPKAEVLNTLIRGNMSTRIAFRVSTVEHSRTILSMPGAHTLPRTIRGRLMARLDSELVTLQGFYITDDKIQALVDGLRAQPVQLLTDLERELVQYAVEHLDGQFNTNKLWPVFRDRIGRDALLALARRWQKRGWLAEQPGVNAPRRVADELRQLVAAESEG
jgi:hypothetical protein